MIKAVFFDFDMTLINSRPIARASYRALLKYSKRKPVKFRFENYVGTRFSESIGSLAQNNAEKKILIKIYLQMHKENIKKIKVYGRKALNMLKKRKIKVLIISNNSREVIRKVCKTHKLYFNQIIADEDLKPGEEKHQAILGVLKKLRIKKKEAIYVGDHINDIKEGKKAGIRVISVTTGVFSKRQLAKHSPYKIINNLNQLEEVI
jgi:HAD superfamily hydrolase (TIGR01549 family)